VTKNNHLLEKRGRHELVYLKDTANISVEIPIFWRDDKKRATGRTSGQSWEHGCWESEAQSVREKRSLCCFDVYISM